MGLKEDIQNHIIVVLGSTLLFGVGIGWVASENIRVNPKIEKIASLQQHVTERDTIISGWKEGFESYRKQAEPLYENNNILEKNLATITSNLKEWKDTLEGYRNQNSKLQKLLNSYETNCSIISEIRNLDKRKAILDGNVRNGWKEHQLESNDLQARMLVFQQKLTCEAK